MAKRRLSFDEAKRMFVHRYTMDHVPAWANEPFKDGGYPAPHYASDREWYENTIFPGEANHPLGTRVRSAYSSGQTWPLGKELDEPFSVMRRNPRHNPLSAHAAAIMGNPHKAKRTKHAQLRKVRRTDPARKWTSEMGEHQSYIRRSMKSGKMERIALQFHAHGLWSTIKLFPPTEAGKRAAIALGKKTHPHLPHRMRAILIYV